MSEAAVAEAPEVVTDPQLSTPSSDATLEVTPVGAGEETPETEPAPRQPDSYNLNELDSLYKDGKLGDPKLVERRETLRQAEDNRQREEARVLAEYRAAEETRVTQLAELGTQTRTNLRKAIETEIAAAYQVGRDPDLNLIAERAEGILAQLEAKTKEIHLAPHEKGLRDALLRLHGDTPQNRRAVSAMEIPDLANELYRTAYALGQNAGPNADSKVTKAAEWHKDGYHTSSYQKGVDDMKAANPTWKTVADTSTARTAGSGLPTREQWASGTYEQRQAWKQQHGDDVSDRIFA